MLRFLRSTGMDAWAWKVDPVWSSHMHWPAKHRRPPTSTPHIEPVCLYPFLGTLQYGSPTQLNCDVRSTVQYQVMRIHYSDVKMSAMASQITSLTIVYPSVYSGADQRKHQSSTSLASVRGIHWWPVNFLHKGPVAQKMIQLTSSCFGCSTQWPVTIGTTRTNRTVKL